MDYGAICLMVNVKNSMGPMYSNVFQNWNHWFSRDGTCTRNNWARLTLHMFYKTLESWYCFYKIMVSY